MKTNDQMRRVGATLVLAFVLASSTAFAASSADAPKLRAQIAAARAHLVAALPKVSDDLRAIPGLFSRLDSDAESLSESAKPAWMSDADFWWVNATMVKLDSSLVEQLASRDLHSIGGVNGEDDVVFRSRADGRLQPLGMYVPPSYQAGRPAPLVVILHGAHQTESDVISAPAVARLAASTGAILAAPYARGDTQYADPASDDIAQAVQMIEGAYSIDRSRVYLAGISMGGFGVYHVAARRPDLFTGYLSIMGGIDDRDRTAAVVALKGRRVFVVAAANDREVSVEASRKMVRDLQSAGVAVSYYEQDGAGHNLNDVFPSVLRAWSDIFKTRAATPAPSLAPTSPEPTPAPVGPPIFTGTPAPRGTPPA